MSNRILIVEDEAITALDIEESLTSFGYEVIGSEDTAEQAVETARREKPDLVLMDVQLRGEMDGVEAATILWNESKTPCVFLTAFADEETLRRAKLSHPYGFILKPFEGPELRATLELAISRIKDESSSVSSPIAQEKKTAARSGTSEETHPVLSKIPQAELSALTSSASKKEIEASKTLLYEGDEIDQAFLVLSGQIFAMQTSIDGKNFIADILGPGDLLSLAHAKYDKISSYTFTAHNNCEILIWSKSALEKTLQETPELQRVIQAYLWDGLRAAHVVQRALAYERVEYRIAAALWQFGKKFYGPEVDSYVVELTRQEVAEVVGTTPETAIRITKMLERDGILDLTKPGRIVVQDREKLEELLEM